MCKLLLKHISRLMQVFLAVNGSFLPWCCQGSQAGWCSGNMTKVQLSWLTVPTLLKNCRLGTHTCEATLKKVPRLPSLLGAAGHCASMLRGRWSTVGCGSHTWVWLAANQSPSPTFMFISEIMTRVGGENSEISFAVIKEGRRHILIMFSVLAQSIVNNCLWKND